MSNNQQITTTLKKTAFNVNFAAITLAMDASNIGSYIEEEYKKFLLENKLDEGTFVPMATHSMGGREWKLEEGSDPLFFEEDLFNGGWYLLKEEEVSQLVCQSALSGSSLTATKTRQGSWNLVLEVPVEDGEPYQGGYWDAFHQALGLVEETEEQEAPQEKADREGPIVSL